MASRSCWDRDGFGGKAAAWLRHGSGLIVSQALTLFTTPVIYLCLDRLSQWIAGPLSAPIEKGSAGHGG